MIEQNKSYQDQFKQLLLTIPVHECNYARSAQEQSIISLAVEMPPPGEQRLYHGHFDAAKFDFTALLAVQHVKTKGLPPAPPRPHYDDYNLLARQRNEEAEALRVAAAVEEAKVSVRAIASSRLPGRRRRTPDRLGHHLTL